MKYSLGISNFLEEISSLSLSVLFLYFFELITEEDFIPQWTKKLQMFKLDLEKPEEPEIKFPTSVGSWEKQESSRKNIYFFFIDYAKAFYFVDHNKLWKILKEMGIPDHLTCLLRNLFAGQEATVRTGLDWF